MQFRYFDIWTKSAAVARESFAKTGAAVMGEMRDCAIDGLDVGSSLAKDMLNAKTVASAIDIQSRYAAKALDSAINHSRAIASTWADFGETLSKSLPETGKALQAAVETDMQRASPKKAA